MDSEPFCVLEIWWPISSGFTTGPAFCWSYFSVKVTCEKSSQLPLRVTENEQNHWGWAIPSSGLDCSGEGRTSKGPWMAPAAPHPGTAHLQVGIPLTGLNQSCSHCHCRQWRETGRCGYCFSNQLGWWRWSFLSASCGRDRMHGFYVAAVCWLRCCTWKAASEPNSCTGYKWFNFQHKFLLLVSSISYTDNVKLVPLQCLFSPPYVLFCGVYLKNKMFFSSIVCIDCMHLVPVYRRVVEESLFHIKVCVSSHTYICIYLYIKL